MVYSISAIASTSTATLSGSEPEPTAERACLPLSPNTSTIRSEAPLTTFGMVGEFGRAIDEADELYDALHPVEIAAAGILELRDDIDGAQPRRLGCLLDGEVLADLALIFDLAVLQRHLARGVDEIAGPDPADIVGDGLRRRRQGDTEFGKFLVDLAHDACLQLCDQVRRSRRLPAGEEGIEIVGGAHAHGDAGIARGAAEMRQQKHIVELAIARIDLRLVAEHVEPGRGELARCERLRSTHRRR